MKKQNIMNIGRWIMLLCLMISTSSTIQAQSVRKKKKEKTESREYTHQLGFNGGMMMGAGPTYRYNTGNIGVQLTLLPIYASGELFVMSSIGVLRNIHRSRYVEFSAIGAVGGSFVNEGSLYALSGGVQSTLKLGRNFDLDIRNGLGVYYGTSGGDGFGVLTQAFGIGLMYNFTY